MFVTKQQSGVLLLFVVPVVATCDMVCISDALDAMAKASVSLNPVQSSGSRGISLLLVQDSRGCAGATTDYAVVCSM